jgi:ribosomal protein S18 acetylase RimI-like enzyme
MNIRPFTFTDTEAIIQLWRDCALVRPWNDPYKDIERKLSVTPEWFLVGTDGASTLMASIMVGYDGHRGWINYLAVHPAHQRQGHASRLMREAETLLTARGCPKLNLQIRADNEAVIAFYESLGYTDDHTVSMGKRLIADH